MFWHVDNDIHRRSHLAFEYFFSFFVLFLKSTFLVAFHSKGDIALGYVYEIIMKNEMKSDKNVN